MDGMTNVCRRKLGWMTSRRLLQVRMLFGTKPRDGSSANTSGGGNRANRMASIKLGENGVLLSSREGSHDSDG